MDSADSGYTNEAIIIWMRITGPKYLIHCRRKVSSPPDYFIFAIDEDPHGRDGRSIEDLKRSASGKPEEQSASNIIDARFFQNSHTQFSIFAPPATSETSACRP